MENSFEYSTIILGALLILSEVMPFIKKTKGNGFIDSIVCMLRGSECVTKKLADVVEQSREQETNENKV